MMTRSFGIRRYFTLLTLLPLLLMATSLASYFLVDRYRDLDNDLLLRGQMMSRQLAVSSEFGLFTNNVNNLNGLVASTLRESDVKSVFLFKDDKLLISAGDVRSTTLSSLSWASRSKPVLDDGDSIWLYEPILSAQIMLDETALDTEAKQIGSVIIELSWKRTDEQKRRLLTTTIVGTLLFLLITNYLIYLASKHIVDPIQELSKAVDAIGAGDLTTHVETPNCINELCTLTNGVNEMATDLLKDRLELQRKIDEATEQLRHLAFHDTLTHLPNRRLLLDRMSNAFAASKRNNHYGAVMFMDLDNFKPLNDQYGHAVGDLLLIETAQRITNCLREIDTVARFGGDEFVVMLDELDEDADRSMELARHVAEKILSSLATPYRLVYQKEGQPAEIISHCCTASLGVKVFHGSTNTQDEVLAAADSAMYQAKQEGRNTIHFHTNK